MWVRVGNAQYWTGWTERTEKTEIMEGTEAEPSPTGH